MRKLFMIAAVLALASCGATPAFAQNASSGSPRVQGVPAGYGDPVQVTLRAADGSAPVLTTGAASSANQTSQITQETAINTKLAAVTRSTAVSSATPGDALAIDTRNLIVKGTFGANQTTAYVGFANVGGLVTISTGLPSGTVLEACRFQVKTLNSYVTVSSALLMYLFDGNPSGSTFTDNVASSNVVADLPKMMSVVSASATGGGAGGVVTWTIPTTACPLVAVDASGNLYAAVVPSAAFQLSNAAALYWSFEARY